MTHEEAQEYALTVRWKVSLCSSNGEKCWCRVIEPEYPVFDKDGEQIYINNAGSISKEHAEHIVKLHNESLTNTNPNV